MKHEFGFKFALEGELLECFLEDIKNHGDGKTPATLSYILSDYYGVADTIKRGYGGVRNARNNIAIKATRDHKVLTFRSTREADRYFGLEETTIWRIMNQKKKNTHKGWKIERA